MKVYIIKDGHKVSDFENEREALIWLASSLDVDVAFELDNEEENEEEEWCEFWFYPTLR